MGTFYKNELENTNQKEFTVEKTLRARGDKLLNGKATIIRSIAG